MQRLLFLPLLLAGCGGHTGTSGSSVEIVRYPKDAIVSLGGAAEFRVEAAGDVRYQWWHEEVRIRGATGPTLHIVARTAADFGDYTVAVTRGGETFRTFAMLFETGTPTLRTQTTGVPVARRITLTAEIEADPAPSYQWYRDAAPGRPGGPVDGATEPTLTVAVPDSDLETYTLYVTNRKGYLLCPFVVSPP